MTHPHSISALIHHSIFPIALALAAVATSPEALAQDTDGGKITIGETFFIPSVRLDFSTIDNVFRSENNEIEVTRLTVRPEVLWSASRRLLDIGAEYKGRFAVSTDEDPGFNDSEFRIFSQAEFSSRNLTFAALSIAAEHIDIGENVLNDATSEDGQDVANFINASAIIRHRFGSRNATGNLFGELFVRNVNYTNRPEFTDGLDFTQVRASGEFGLRFSQDTRGLIGIRLEGFDFDDDLRDRTDISPFLGLIFSATGKLSGDFRIGVTQSEFSESLREDSTSAFAQANLSYKPSSFSTITLELSREIDNATGSAVAQDSPIATIIALGWRNAWSSRITTNLAVAFDDLDAECPDASENTIEPSFDLTYSVRRWISVGFQASYEERTASLCDNIGAEILEEFDRTEAGVFVRATL